MATPKYQGILFLCTGNSCRSQMAEGFARLRVPPGVRVYSAGTAPTGEVHPLAIRVMAEAGVDISGHRSKSLAEIPLYSVELVVTVCGTADDACPAPPRTGARMHWPTDDPAKAAGSEEEVLAVFRRVRDELRQRVGDLVEGFL